MLIQQCAGSLTAIALITKEAPFSRCTSKHGGKPILCYRRQCPSPQGAHGGVMQCIIHIFSLRIFFTAWSHFSGAFFSPKHCSFSIFSVTHSSPWPLANACSGAIFPLAHNYSYLKEETAGTAIRYSSLVEHFNWVGKRREGDVQN